MGYANVACQWNIGTWELSSKIVIIIVVLVCLLKTFFFMRIVQKFSYIVTMITMVIGDLKVFMIFFVILIFMFSLIFDVISINRSPEYSNIGYLMGNVFTTLRLSLGDFDFSILVDEEHPLTAAEHVIFWSSWLIMVLFSALIFLNFIIAEVSNSYAKVKEEINALIFKERATLIQEAEDIMTTKTKETDQIKFPKYIVLREMEK